MRHYIMPEQIEINNRIIIWGAGTMGRQLLSMARKKGIEVLKILDKEADLFPKQNHIMSTELPTALCKVDKTEYDYIIVAVENRDVQEEIVETLRQWNIEMSKVVIGAEYYDDVMTLDSPEARANSMIHFSWYGEDMIVANLFYRVGIKNPTYLDIGCNAPFLGSNTAFFYCTGSRGVCVDANPEMIAEMRINRQDDISLSMGVVPNDSEGKKVFHVLAENGLSTFKDEYAEEYYITHATKYNKEKNNNIEIETHSLKYIVEQYCDGIWPDFLDIDIEGYDDEVIQSTFFAGNGPKVICIESHDKKTREHLVNQGYSLHTYTSHNDIWVRNDFYNKLSNW